jgi:DNA phosphorothioation-dependent restriction protein DptH
VVDEAHRILKADYMERFSLECRAYGVGLFLSSQYPSHFPPAVSASLSTKIIHGNDRDYDRVRDIANLIGYNGHEAEIGGLGMFEAVISNRQYQNVLIKTMNYPLYLLHSFLLNREELTREEISDIEGIETSQTSVDSIIAQIEKLGLAEESDGRIRLLSHHG